MILEHNKLSMDRHYRMRSQEVWRRTFSLIYYRTEFDRVFFRDIESKSGVFLKK